MLEYFLRIELAELQKIFQTQEDAKKNYISGGGPQRQFFFSYSSLCLKNRETTCKA